MSARSLGEEQLSVPLSTDSYCTHVHMQEWMDEGNREIASRDLGFWPRFWQGVSGRCGSVTCKSCSPGALGLRVGALDVLWVEGLPTSSAQISTAEACSGGQRGRHSEQAEDKRARAPTYHARTPPGPLLLSQHIGDRARSLESSRGTEEPFPSSHHRI